MNREMISVPFLLAVLRLALEPAEESRVGRQTVAVTGRLEQLDLSYHLKLLQRERNVDTETVRQLSVRSI